MDLDKEVEIIIPIEIAAATKKVSVPLFAARKKSFSTKANIV